MDESDLQSSAMQILDTVLMFVEWLQMQTKALGARNGKPSSQLANSYKKEAAKFGVLITTNDTEAQLYQCMHNLLLCATVTA